MATSRFSLTLFCPMNSCSRCGLSFSSKDESSSTGAAETRRSLTYSAELSLAADTEAMVKRKVESSNCRRESVPQFYRMCEKQAMCLLRLLPNHAQPNALQFAGVKPSHLLPEPGFRATEFVLLGRRWEVTRTEQISDRRLAKLRQPVREPSSTRRRSQNHGLAGKVCQLAEIFLRLSDRLGPAVSLAE